MSSSAEVELARELARLEVYIERLLEHCRRAGAWGYPLLDEPAGTNSVPAARDGSP